MRYSEVILALQNLINREVKQADIVKATGLSRATISNREKNDVEFFYDDVKKIEQHFNVNFKTAALAQFHAEGATGVQNSDTVDIPYYPDIVASCGNGGFALEYPPRVNTLPVSLELGFERHGKYFAIDAFGDSMEKTIYDNQKVIFEDWQNRQIIDNKIYFFIFEGRYYIKRLAFNVDEVIVMSDNPKYETKKIKACDFEQLNIFGRFKAVIE